MYHRAVKTLSKRKKMADTLEADIIRILTDTRDKIRGNMDAQGVNASGRTSASIRVEPYEGGVKLVGGTDSDHTIQDSPGIYGNDTAPIPTLELGRKEGGVPRGFYYIIREWTREKGINFESETERNTFAYFVSRKIANEGSQRYREPSKRKDIYSTPVEEATAKINAILQESISRTVRAALGGSSVTGLKGAFN